MKLPNLNFFTSIPDGEPIPPGFGARLGQTLRAIANQSANHELQTNANPQGQPVAPPPINGITVAAANGHHTVTITDQNKGIKRGVNYWLERDTSPHFPNPHIIDLGQSRNHSEFLGNGTYYWRGYSSYGSSGSSAPAYHGSAQQPVAVSAGGDIGSPVELQSQGSGTGAPAQGLVGPGPVPIRDAATGTNWRRQGTNSAGIVNTSGVPAVPFTAGGAGGGGSTLTQPLYSGTHSARLSTFPSVRYPVNTQFYETDRTTFYWVQNATGTVTVTTGTTVTWVSGNHFINTGSGFTAGQWPAGTAITINGVVCRVASVSSSTVLTLQTATTNAAGVSYSVASGRWVYLAGEYAAALASLPTDLGENETVLVSAKVANGFLFFENNAYGHQIQWNVSAWQRGPHDEEHSDQFVMVGSVPSDLGWHACDGSTQNYMKYDGTTGSRVLPNTNSTASYPKLGGSYSATLNAPTVPTFTGNAVTPAGTNSAPTFTGTVASIVTQGMTLGGNQAMTSLDGSSSSYTPRGNVSAPTFTGIPLTPSGTIALPADPIENVAIILVYRQ